MERDISKLKISRSTSVLDALRVIDYGSCHIALVVNDESKLLGTLTDGDIRRGLLHGKSLQNSVAELMNTNFIYLTDGEDDSLIQREMKQRCLRHLPILDKEGILLGLKLIDDGREYSALKNPVVIMAGGRGTRLLPLTKDCPKPMLRIGKKPMLEILIEQCIESGLNDIFISVNYLKEQIIDYFKDGSKKGVQIRYLEEKKPLGTAGSLSLLKDRVDKPFLVLNGDVLTRVPLAQIVKYHYENTLKATICVRHHNIAVPYGVVETDGISFKRIREKPVIKTLVNAGMYIIDPGLLSMINDKRKMDMTELIELTAKSGQPVGVCPIHEYWVDAGLPETLREASMEWA